MLTIFSIPKPFLGHAAVIQRNAIRSWTRLQPKCEVFLCGNDAGTEQVAAELGVYHLPDIACNEFGTPYLNSAFEQAVAHAHNPILCYVNADIILLNDFVQAVSQIQFTRFLMAGRRWNIDLAVPWDFDDPDWQSRLREHVLTRGELFRAKGSDYFVFPPDGELENLPSFTVGRPYWDGWFMYHARQLHVPLLDATHAVMAVHQNHDYGHVSAARRQWRGPEGDRNLELIQARNEIFFNLFDATHLATPKGIVPARGMRYFRRRIYTMQYLIPATRIPVRVAYRFWRAARFLPA